MVKVDVEVTKIVQVKVSVETELQQLALAIVDVVNKALEKET